MTLTFQTKTKSGYVIAFLLLVVSYFLIFYIVQKLVKGTKAISHSYSVINKLETLRSNIADAETGVRGYIITRKVSYLMPYYASIKSIPVQYNELSQLTSTNQSPYLNLEMMKRLVDLKLALLSDAIKNFQDEGFMVTDEMARKDEQGRVVMDSIRKLVGQAKSTEEKLIEEKTGNLGGFFNSTNFIAISSLLVAILTVIFSMATYNMENAARKKADMKARLYQSELENKLHELKRVNMELHELKQTEKFATTGRIASTIAHEVRNPLTNISLAAEQLNEGFPVDGEPALLLDMIRRNARRIDQLVVDLLQSTRFVQLEFSVVDINKLIDETLEHAMDRIGLNQVQIEKEYSTELCNVTIDAEKMKLAILNIIVNAVEAMEKNKGILTIKTYKKEDRCFVEIKDNGSGMEEETLQRIFEPYFTNKKKGTGLGLTNTQNIIFSHKGKIGVWSKPGEGTRFIVSLQLS